MGLPLLVVNGTPRLDTCGAWSCFQQWRMVFWARWRALLLSPWCLKPQLSRSHDVTGWLLLCWHKGASCYGRTEAFHSPQCRTVVQNVVGLQHWESTCRFRDIKRSSPYAALCGFNLLFFCNSAASVSLALLGFDPLFDLVRVMCCGFVLWVMCCGFE